MTAKAVRHLWVICLIVIAALPESILANTLPQSRFALVIGNSAYATAGHLPNATHDAELIGKALEDAGFAVDLRRDLDLQEFDAVLDLLEIRVREFDVIALYFAGHGIQFDGVNYLLPVDAQIRNARALARETILLDQLLDILQDAGMALVFLDACRNNPLAEQLSADQIADERGARALRQGLAVVRPPAEMLISYATLPGEVAYDGGFGNSPYARALARHLLTPDVEVSVLMKRVTRDVLEETNARQRPQQMSQMQEEFYFRTGSGEGVQEVGDETLLAVYPGRVGTGDEIALFADVPVNCAPNFFALSSAQTLIPIPEEFFSTHGLANGMLRFEISPGTRYGLVVTEEDPRGAMQIGFYCAQDGARAPQETLALLTRLEQKVAQGLFAGRLDTEAGGSVLYHVAQIEIE
ncbi:MAG: caspase family protein [Natronohydrobacter sp.]|nr:caspase family protein [Natronohydrobacter sp.]